MNAMRLPTKGPGMEDMCWLHVPDLALLPLLPLYTHTQGKQTPFIIEGKLGEPSIFFFKNKEALKIAGNLDHINNIGDSYHK